MYRVMFIDDEPWVLYGLSKIIDWKELGYETVGSFSNAQTALETIRREKPDVVITDIRMPNLSGMELINFIRDENLPIEVIIISAYKDFNVARMAIRQGVAEYLTKPLKQDEVLQVMEKIKKKLSEKRIIPRKILELSEKVSFQEGHSDILIQAGRQDIWERLDEAACHDKCYVLLSRKGFEEELTGWEGKFTEIYVKGFRESYLYSSSCFIEKDLVFGGASMPRKNFLMAGQMVKEARLALEGGFSYSMQEQTAKIQYYLADHYAEKISMKELSEYFYLSEPYLFELFRKYTNTTIVNFVRNIRLFHALNLLDETDMTIQQVAEKVGYEDPGYFSRLFKKQYSASPEAYRKK